VTLVVDLRRVWSTWNQVRYTKLLLRALQDHYPTKVGTCYIVASSVFVRMSMSMFRSWHLTAEFHDKVVVATSPKAFELELDGEELTMTFGGVIKQNNRGWVTGRLAAEGARRSPDMEKLRFYSETALEQARQAVSRCRAYSAKCKRRAKKALTRTKPKPQNLVDSAAAAAASAATKGESPAPSLDASLGIDAAANAVEEAAAAPAPTPVEAQSVEHMEQPCPEGLTYPAPQRPTAPEEDPGNVVSHIASAPTTERYPIEEDDHITPEPSVISTPKGGVDVETKRHLFVGVTTHL